MKKEKKAGLVWKLVGKVTLVIIVLGGLIGFVVVPKVSAATGCFPDTDGHWAETFICWLKDNGITGGYPDGSCHGTGRTDHRGHRCAFRR